MYNFIGTLFGFYLFVSCLPLHQEGSTPTAEVLAHIITLGVQTAGIDLVTFAVCNTIFAFCLCISCFCLSTLYSHHMWKFWRVLQHAKDWVFPETWLRPRNPDSLLLLLSRAEVDRHNNPIQFN